jgi:D-alanyl-D-alanine-carboxypeptidase/D-alanyl-D-alanine-endopeptidase
LKKGKRIQEVSSLFPYLTNAHRIFLNQSAKAVLYNAIKSESVEGAIEKYYEMKSQSDKRRGFNISENDINSLGYQLLRSNKTEQAIEIFKLNVAEYPDSWNVYDSLAEAYMKNGDSKLAIKNYSKSLELNPKNTNAVEMLEKIKKKE